VAAIKTLSALLREQFLTVFGVTLCRLRPPSPGPGGSSRQPDSVRMLGRRALPTMALPCAIRARPYTRCNIQPFCPRARSPQLAARTTCIIASCCLLAGTGAATRRVSGKSHPPMPNSQSSLAPLLRCWTSGAHFTSTPPLDLAGPGEMRPYCADCGQNVLPASVPGEDETRRDETSEQPLPGRAWLVKVPPRAVSTRVETP